MKAVQRQNMEAGDPSIVNVPSAPAEELEYVTAEEEEEELEYVTVEEEEEELEYMTAEEEEESEERAAADDVPLVPAVRVGIDDSDEEERADVRFHTPAPLTSTLSNTPKPSAPRSVLDAFMDFSADNRDHEVLLWSHTLAVAREARLARRPIPGWIEQRQGRWVATLTTQSLTPQALSAQAQYRRALGAKPLLSMDPGDPYQAVLLTRTPSELRRMGLLRAFNVTDPPSRPAERDQWVWNAKKTQRFPVHPLGSGASARWGLRQGGVGVLVWACCGQRYEHPGCWRSRDGRIPQGAPRTLRWGADGKVKLGDQWTVDPQGDVYLDQRSAAREMRKTLQGAEGQAMLGSLRKGGYQLESHARVLRSVYTLQFMANEPYEPRWPVAALAPDAAWVAYARRRFALPDPAEENLQGDYDPKRYESDPMAQLQYARRWLDADPDTRDPKIDTEDETRLPMGKSTMRAAIDALLDEASELVTKRRLYDTQVLERTRVREGFNMAANVAVITELWDAMETALKTAEENHKNRVKSVLLFIEKDPYPGYMLPGGEIEAYDDAYDRVATALAKLLQQAGPGDLLRQVEKLLRGTLDARFPFTQAQWAAMGGDDVVYAALEASYADTYSAAIEAMSAAGGAKNEYYGAVASYLGAYGGSDPDEPPPDEALTTVIGPLRDALSAHEASKSAAVGAYVELFKERVVRVGTGGQVRAANSPSYEDVWRWYMGEDLGGAWPEPDSPENVDELWRLFVERKSAYDSAAELLSEKVAPGVSVEQWYAVWGKPSEFPGLVLTTDDISLRYDPRYSNARSMQQAAQDEVKRHAKQHAEYSSLLVTKRFHVDRINRLSQQKVQIPVETADLIDLYVAGRQGREDTTDAQELLDEIYAGLGQGSEEARPSASPSLQSSLQNEWLGEDAEDLDLDYGRYFRELKTITIPTRTDWARVWGLPGTYNDAVPRREKHPLLLNEQLTPDGIYTRYSSTHASFDAWVEEYKRQYNVYNKSVLVFSALYTKIAQEYKEYRAKIDGLAQGVSFTPGTDFGKQYIERLGTDIATFAGEEGRPVGETRPTKTYAESIIVRLEQLRAARGITAGGGAGEKTPETGAEPSAPPESGDIEPSAPPPEYPYTTQAYADLGLLLFAADRTSAVQLEAPEDLDEVLQRVRENVGQYAAGFLKIVPALADIVMEEEEESGEMLFWRDNPGWKALFAYAKILWGWIITGGSTIYGDPSSPLRTEINAFVAAETYDAAREYMAREYESASERLRVDWASADSQFVANVNRKVLDPNTPLRDRFAFFTQLCSTPESVGAEAPGFKGRVLTDDQRGYLIDLGTALGVYKDQRWTEREVMGYNSAQYALRGVYMAYKAITNLAGQRDANLDEMTWGDRTGSQWIAHAVCNALLRLMLLYASSPRALVSQGVASYIGSQIGYIQAHEDDALLQQTTSAVFGAKQPLPAVGDGSPLSFDTAFRLIVWLRWIAERKRPAETDYIGDVVAAGNDFFEKMSPLMKEYQIPVMADAAEPENSWWSEEALEPIKKAQSAEELTRGLERLTAPGARRPLNETQTRYVRVVAERIKERQKRTPPKLLRDSTQSVLKGLTAREHLGLWVIDDTEPPALRKRDSASQLDVIFSGAVDEQFPTEYKVYLGPDAETGRKAVKVLQELTTRASAINANSGNTEYLPGELPALSKKSLQELWGEATGHMELGTDRRNTQLTDLFEQLDFTGNEIFSEEERIQQESKWAEFSNNSVQLLRGAIWLYAVFVAPEQNNADGGFIETLSAPTEYYPAIQSDIVGRIYDFARPRLLLSLADAPRMSPEDPSSYDELTRLVWKMNATPNNENAFTWFSTIVNKRDGRRLSRGQLRHIQTKAGEKLECYNKETNTWDKCADITRVYRILGALTDSRGYNTDFGASTLTALGDNKRYTARSLLETANLPEFVVPRRLTEERETPRDKTIKWLLVRALRKAIKPDISASERKGDVKEYRAANTELKNSVGVVRGAPGLENKLRMQYAFSPSQSEVDVGSLLGNFAGVSVIMLLRAAAWLDMVSAGTLDQYKTRLDRIPWKTMDEKGVEVDTNPFVAIAAESELYARFEIPAKTIYSVEPLTDDFARSVTELEKDAIRELTGAISRYYTLTSALSNRPLNPDQRVFLEPVMQRVDTVLSRSSDERSVRAALISFAKVLHAITSADQADAMATVAEIPGASDTRSEALGELAEIVAQIPPAETKTEKGKTPGEYVGELLELAGIWEDFAKTPGSSPTSALGSTLGRRGAFSTKLKEIRDLLVGSKELNAFNTVTQTYGGQIYVPGKGWDFVGDKNIPVTLSKTLKSAVMSGTPRLMVPKTMFGERAMNTKRVDAVWSMVSKGFVYMLRKVVDIIDPGKGGTLGNAPKSAFPLITDVKKDRMAKVARARTYPPSKRVYKFLHKSYNAFALQANAFAGIPKDARSFIAFLEEGGKHSAISTTQTKISEQVFMGDEFGWGSAGNTEEEEEEEEEDFVGTMDEGWASWE